MISEQEPDNLGGYLSTCSHDVGTMAIQRNEMSFI